MFARDIHVADETFPSLGGVHQFITEPIEVFFRSSISDVLRHPIHRKDLKFPECFRSFILKTCSEELCNCSSKSPSENHRRLQSNSEPLTLGAGVPGVAIHCAMHTYRAASIDEWRKFLRVTSRRHDHQSLYPLKKVAPEHPILKGIPESQQRSGIHGKLPV